MKQAIETKYLGPTNHKGSRVKATCQAGSITVAWDYGLNGDENHVQAMSALVDKLNWDGPASWIGGSNVKGDGYCFVNNGGSK